MTMLKKDILFVFLLAAFMALPVASAETPESGEAIELAYEIDTPEAYIGDRITFSVTAPEEKDIEIIFPEEPENLGDFTFISSSPVRSRFGAPSRVGMSYVVTIYSTGTHVIPPVTVRYKRVDEDEWSYATSPQIPLEIKSLLSEDDEDIRDLKGFIRRGIGKRAIFTAFLLVLALGVVILALWFRKKRIREIEEAARNRTAEEIAYEELRALKAMDLPGKGMVKEYYIRLSDIVRRYIEKRFALRAPEMTTEEFLEGLRESSLLSPAHKELLREFLSHCDLVKFARYGPTQLEMLDSFKSAEKLVDQTRRPADDEEEL
jgi:hypothetical protein